MNIKVAAFTVSEKSSYTENLVLFHYPLVELEACFQLTYSETNVNSQSAVLQLLRQPCPLTRTYINHVSVDMCALIARERRQAQHSMS